MGDALDGSGTADDGGTTDASSTTGTSSTTDSTGGASTGRPGGSTDEAGPPDPTDATGITGPGTTTDTGSAGTTDDFGQACTSEYHPVCGTDGETYDHPCSVPDGVEIKREGPCFGDCEGSCTVAGSPMTVTLALVALLLLRPRRARG